MSVSTTNPRPVTRSGKEVLFAALQTMCLFALPVLAVLGYAAAAGAPSANPFPSNRAGWLVLTAVAAIGLLTGLLLAAKGKTFSLVPASNPSFYLVTSVLLGVVVSSAVVIAVVTPPKKSQEQILLEQQMAAMQQQIDTEQEKQRTLAAQVANREEEVRRARAEGKQPDPAKERELADLRTQLAESKKNEEALKTAKTTTEKRVEDLGNGATPKTPEEVAKENDPGLSKPSVGKENPVPTLNPNPDGGLPPPPPPPSGGKKDALADVAKVAAMILVAKFPALAPIAAALGLNLGLGGVEKRDLPAVTQRAGEIFEGGKKLDIPATVKKVLGDRFQNPTTAINGLMELLKSSDPKVQAHIEGTIGKAKAVELLEQLEMAKLLWARLDKVAYALGGGDKAHELCKELPPKLADSAALTEYASKTPANFTGVSSDIWRAVLIEYVNQAAKGQALTVGADGKLAPFTMSAADATAARDAINKAKPKPTKPANDTDKESEDGSKVKPKDKPTTGDKK